MASTVTPAKTCDPNEVAIKSFFLGPQSENAEWLLGVLQDVLKSYFSWRRGIYPDDGRAISADDLNTPEFRESRRHFVAQLQTLMSRFEAEVPKFSPRYIGHMFSETSMPAMVGHVMTLLHNPNNISGESSRVGVAIEDEAIGALAKMLGLSENTQGHFTSGGTVANFEAMVRARRRMERFIEIGARARHRDLHNESLFDVAHMGWDAFDGYLRGFLDKGQDMHRYDLTRDNPFVVAARLGALFGEPYRGPVILVPEHKHYSWVKGVHLMGLGQEAFWPVRLDQNGVVCVGDLQAQIEKARTRDRPVMMVVSVAGTTELGAFDPIHEVQNLLDRYKSEGIHIWHHVDAAYGGFFASNICGNQDCCVMAEGVCEAVEAISRTNSVTLDPHKLGYVPYSSGAFVCADPREYFASSIDAPYLELEDRRDKGPQTIEGSRSAAGAVATWLTAKTIGLDGHGYGRILRRTIAARRRLQQELEAIAAPVRMIAPSSNLLAFCVARDGEPMSRTNARTQAIYEAFSPHKDSEFFVSRTSLRFTSYKAFLDPFLDRWNAEKDTEELMLIRLCVMNPFFDSQETNVDFPAAFASALQGVVEG